jgi:PEP-CTERM motif
VRSNGSTYQLANFNPTTGAPASPEYYQTEGFFATSVWARGQAWALYGFVQAYQTSDNPAFLKTAEGIANYFVGHLPKTTDIPPWDFDAPPSPIPPIDTSAAAIVADGLVMLSTVAGTALKTVYLQDAENILGSLSSSYLDRSSAPGESVLLDGHPGGLSAKNTALIYSDYYFTEALLRLQEVLDGKPGCLLYSPPVAVPLHSLAAAEPLYTQAIPEPSTWAMMLVGFAGLGFAGYRVSRKTDRRCCSTAPWGVGERREQICQPRIAVLLDEPENHVAPPPPARLADDRQHWLADVGKGEGVF